MDGFPGGPGPPAHRFCTACVSACVCSRARSCGFVRFLSLGLLSRRSAEFLVSFSLFTSETFMRPAGNFKAVYFFFQTRVSLSLSQLTLNMSPFCQSILFLAKSCKATILQYFFLMNRTLCKVCIHTYKLLQDHTSFYAYIAGHTRQIYV